MFESYFPYIIELQHLWVKKKTCRFLQKQQHKSLKYLNIESNNITSGILIIENVIWECIQCQLTTPKQFKQNKFNYVQPNTIIFHCFVDSEKRSYLIYTTNIVNTRKPYKEEKANEIHSEVK